MEWFERDFDHPLYFEIYSDKAEDASTEGPALVDLLDLKPGSLVLDLPCGWGRLHPFLVERGLNVIGGDLSTLNLARHHKNDPDCPLAQLDFRALPFADQCCEGVFCAFTSWGYFASDEENLLQLQEFNRVLRPGGVLLLDLTGRHHLEKALRGQEDQWYSVNDRYRERVRWSADHRRVYTERLMQGLRFRHDIWVPDNEDIMTFAIRAGFQLDQRYGSLQGENWRFDSERWIYRFYKP